MNLAFWATTALLLAGALMFVLPPLVRRNAAAREGPSPLAVYREQRAQSEAELAQGLITPAQHAQVVDELQVRVIDEVADTAGPATPPGLRGTSLASVLAVALLVPAGALALYGLLGQPAALVPPSAKAPAAGDAPHAMSREDMEAMVETLAEKLKKNPNDADGWHMLARSYVSFGRLPEAAQAYDHASKLAPNDPQVLADYADTLAMVNGRSLEGPPMQLVNAALKIAPNHAKSLALAGTAAFNRGDFEGAAAYWQKLLATLPPGSEQARGVATNIAQAQAEAQKGPAPVAAASVAANTANGAIAGTVTIADALKTQVASGSVLFVYARAVHGPRMPIAILRLSAGQLPSSFKLDDSLAMSPQFKLSGQTEVALVARVSRTGNAMEQPGDLLGTVTPVKVGSQGVSLVIGEVVR
jgi:cytochrome c-type biogenesis protein CcmH